jgi:hypothetical protein
MQEVTVSDLKKAKVNLEKQIKSLLVDFSLTNGVTVSGLKLNTYSVRSIEATLPRRFTEVEVELILDRL